MKRQTEKRTSFIVGDYVRVKGCGDTNFWIAKKDSNFQRFWLDRCDTFGSAYGWCEAKDLRHAPLLRQVTSIFFWDRMVELIQALYASLNAQKRGKKQIVMMEWVSYHLGRACSGLYGDPRLERLSKALQALQEDWDGYREVLQEKKKPKRKRTVKKTKPIPDLAHCNSCGTLGERRAECRVCGNWIGESSKAATVQEIRDWQKST